MRIRAAKRSAAYSLVEMMIAAGVLALATGGIYSAFLQANNVAINARSLTAARYILQRAADQALTATWDVNAKAPVDGGNLPEVLNIHYPSDAVQSTDPLNPGEPFSMQNYVTDPATGLPDNSVVLLADPHSDPAYSINQIITAKLYRKAVPISITTNSNTLLRITFTLKYQVNGVDRAPQTLTILRTQG